METALPTIHFARLRAKARLPHKRPEDAGYDIYACLKGHMLCIAPFSTALVPTGIASACPAGYYFQIQERGSTGSRGLAKRSGVIDSGYRGEWFLAMTNLNPLPLYIAEPALRPLLVEAERAGRALVHYTDKAIAQAVLHSLPDAALVELSAEELLSIPSARGSGALGSTDKI